MLVEFVKQAHDYNLIVHPYTFRRDSLPEYANSLDELFRMFYFIIGVDGVFTDFPDLTARFVESNQ